MSIGTTIKKIRRQKDMTQEILAEYLHVSVSAVSQWEIEKTMPDITAIAPLCNVLDITSDELLGIDVEKRKEKIQAIRDEADKYSSKGYHAQARPILERGISEFPNSYELMVDLMYLAFWQNNGQNAAFLDEAIRYGEAILEGCMDNDIRTSAIQVLCFSYSQKKDFERAKGIAQQAGWLAVSRESLFISATEGDEKYQYIKRYLYNLYQFLSRSLTDDCQLDNGEWAYTADEQAALRDKQIALGELMFEKGDYGFYHTTLSSIHRSQAVYYAEKNNAGPCLDHLGKAAHHAVKFLDYAYGGPLTHTSLIFKGHFDAPCFATNVSDNDASEILSAMNEAKFDFVRNDPKFSEIETSLKEHAGKWKIN